MATKVQVSALCVEVKEMMTAALLMCCTVPVKRV